MQEYSPGEKKKPKTSEKKDKLPSYLKEEEKPTFFEEKLGPLEEDRLNKENKIKEELDDFSQM